jgi:hypothetical protein
VAGRECFQSIKLLRDGLYIKIMASETVVPFIFVSCKGLLNVFKICIFEFELIILKVHPTY